MDIGKDSCKKPNGVNFLTFDWTEGVLSAGIDKTAARLCFIDDKRWVT